MQLLVIISNTVANKILISIELNVYTQQYVAKPLLSNEHYKCFMALIS